MGTKYFFQSFTITSGFCDFNFLLMTTGCFLHYSCLGWPGQARSAAAPEPPPPAGRERPRSRARAAAATCVGVGGARGSVC